MHTRYNLNLVEQEHDAKRQEIRKKNMHLTNLLVPSEELLARATIPCAALCNLQHKEMVRLRILFDSLI
jgi:hypothetical protein